MNAVENPIINSPFREPAQHYDFSGVEPRIVDGRRPAGYHGTVCTERMEGPLAVHEFISLPVLNDIRSRVREWRHRGWPGITPVTRDLLEHWHREDRKPLFFCQREAVETLIWLTEASPADRQGIAVPVDEPNDPESIKKQYAALRRYCAKMATGSGKTTVMAMVAAWSILNKVANRQDARFSDSVLIVGPNLTVKERLQVLAPQRAGNYYEKFDLVPGSYRDMLARGRVMVTNWHVFSVKDDSRGRGIVQRGRESDTAFCKRILDRDLGKASGLLVLNDEAHHAYRPAPRGEDDDQLAFEELTAEERAEAEEFAEEATVWVGGLDRINKIRGIRMVVDVSATPFYLKGTGYPEGSPLPWIVSDFGLVDAIESGITKVPRIPVMDDAGKPDPKYFHLWREIQKGLPESERETNRRRAKPESVWREAQGALTILAGKWKSTSKFFQECQYDVPPAFIVVAANTTLAKLIADDLKKGAIINELAGDYTFQIDTKVLGSAEAAEGGTKEDAAQRLRITTATVGKAAWPEDKPPEGFEDMPEPPGKNIRAVVSVGMLTEGWDAQNVTQILGLRAFSSQLLCEQVVGRGLRRMNYDVDPATGHLTPEYCDVFGIPFEVIPVQGVQPKVIPVSAPSTLVQALPIRKDKAIEFPRVEGYVMDVRQRIRCNVDALPELRVEPQIEPTEVVTRTQMGWVKRAGPNTTSGNAETLTRQQFYEQHRLQRTAFELARDITEVLAGGKVVVGKQPETVKRLESARLLFPQVLRVVERFIENRVVLAVPNARREEIALGKYREAILTRLLDAIEPDTDAGEAPILPRIERHRPVGSTRDVQFRTVKPTKETWKSHISHVVLDSPQWEGMAAYHLEQCKRVTAYARNDRLDFEILYEWQAASHKYRPDYLVRLDAGDEGEATLILEIKGYEREQDRAKWTAAQKWVKAVNHHGGFGRWDLMNCKDPNKLRDMLEKYRVASAA